MTKDVEELVCGEWKLHRVRPGVGTLGFALARALRGAATKVKSHNAVQGNAPIRSTFRPIDDMDAQDLDQVTAEATKGDCGQRRLFHCI